MSIPSDVAKRAFLDRVAQSVSRTVVVYTSSRRTYAGTLRAVDEVSDRLDARRIEAVEVMGG